MLRVVYASGYSRNVMISSATLTLVFLSLLFCHWKGCHWKQWLEVDSKKVMKLKTCCIKYQWVIKWSCIPSQPEVKAETNNKHKICILRGRCKRVDTPPSLFARCSLPTDVLFFLPENSVFSHLKWQYLNCASWCVSAWLLVLIDC